MADGLCHTIGIGYDKMKCGWGGERVESHVLYDMGTLFIRLNVGTLLNAGWMKRLEKYHHL